VTASVDHTIKIWTKEGECLHTLTGHLRRIDAVAAMLNGFVTGSYDQTGMVWQCSRKASKDSKGGKGK